MGLPGPHLRLDKQDITDEQKTDGPGKLVAGETVSSLGRNLGMCKCVVETNAQSHFSQIKGL